MKLSRRGVTALAVFLIITSEASGAAADEILFWSNQAQPPQEAQKLRDQVLAGFSKPVKYQPEDPGPYMTRIQAETQAGVGTISLIGGTHGDFASFADNLIGLGELLAGLESANINSHLLRLGQLGTGEQKYVPWMQAGYVMVANRQALQLLPHGADVNALTYDQLIAWGKAIREASGEPKIGFPAGPKGLMHRFLQGFLYPSYTHSVVRKFRSAEAKQMWGQFKDLWDQVNPDSVHYNFMQEPLLSGDVWVAWDHVARLQDALNKKPDQFVVFAAPAGPAGRGFMTVLAGIGIPKTSPNVGDAMALTAYMLRPQTQIATLRATAFFPVVDVELPPDLPMGIQMTGPALTAESEASDAVASVLPSGLGGASGQFNKVFTDTFIRIVLKGEDIGQALDQQSERLRTLIAQVQAPCWAPDTSSEGPCPVE